MALLSGMVLNRVSSHIGAAGNKTIFAGSGTYTAADFSVGPTEGLGFEPNEVTLINLTDRVTMEQFVDSGLDGGDNAKGMKTIADGTRTYEATGLSVSNRTVSVDVSVALLTDDDDFILICER